MPPRTFTGIMLPPEAVALLHEACDEFRTAAPSWGREKWVAPVNLHVTLRFIGPLPDEDIASAVDALARAGGRTEPFSLSLAGLRAVPQRRRASMIWAVLEDADDACAGLSAEVTDALAPFGVQPEQRPFSAHVTLARARKTRSAPAEAIRVAEAALERADTASRVVSVRGFTLFSSTLTPTGPVYEELAFLPLRGVDSEHVFV